MARARAILKKARGNEHPDVAAVVAYTADLLADQGRFAEAEPFAREGLALVEKLCPNGWPFPQSQASLGGILLGQSNYVDAEAIASRRLQSNEPKPGKNAARRAASPGQGDGPPCKLIQLDRPSGPSRRMGKEAC